MRGLTVILAGGDPARIDAGLTLANAQAALGGACRVYLHDAAVTLLDRSELLDIAQELGVEIIACQTALDTHRVTLPEGVSGGGMIGLIADTGDGDRIVIA